MFYDHIDELDMTAAEVRNHLVQLEAHVIAQQTSLESTMARAAPRWSPRRRQERPTGELACETE